MGPYWYVKLTFKQQQTDAEIPAKPSNRKNYERQEQLDGYAFDAFEDVDVARRWIASPCADLGGLSPADAATSDLGLNQALDLLAQIRLARHKRSDPSNNK
jgi:uncharacterized protein (DUF2384 family)